MKSAQWVNVLTREQAYERNSFSVIIPNCHDFSIWWEGGAGKPQEESKFNKFPSRLALPDEILNHLHVCNMHHRVARWLVCHSFYVVVCFVIRSWQFSFLRLSIRSNISGWRGRIQVSHLQSFTFFVSIVNAKAATNKSVYGKLYLQIRRK